MRVGFIGLGNMGAAMAGNLLHAGHEVIAYNRDSRKVQALLERGAARASTVAAACDAEAAFTMLSDDAALESVVFGEGGILASLAPGGIHISCSTISAALCSRLTAAHFEHRQRFLAAPVFGRPEAAVQGKLFIVAGGDAEVLETARPLLQAIGQRTFHIGAEPSRASLVKLSGNFLIASVIEALGEAMALIGKAGIERQAYLEILTSTLFNAPVYKTYGALIASRSFSPAAFSATLGDKDIRLTLAAAADLKVPMPLASMMRDRFLRLIAGGDGHLDWSALGGLSLSDAGLGDTKARHE